MAKQRKESEMQRENNIIKTKQKFTALFWGVGGTTCEQSTSTSHFCDISTDLHFRTVLQVLDRLFSELMNSNLKTRDI